MTTISGLTATKTQNGEDSTGVEYEIKGGELFRVIGRISRQKFDDFRAGEVEMVTTHSYGPQAISYGDKLTVRAERFEGAPPETIEGVEIEYGPKD